MSGISIFRIPREQTIDFVALQDGIQTIDVPLSAKNISLQVNGLGQSSDAFETSLGNVSIPVDMQIVAGDVLTITYWN